MPVQWQSTESAQSILHLPRASFSRKHGIKAKTYKNAHLLNGERTGRIGKEEEAKLCCDSKLLSVCLSVSFSFPDFWFVEREFVDRERCCEEEKKGYFTWWVNNYREIHIHSFVVIRHKRDHILELCGIRKFFNLTNIFIYQMMLNCAAAACYE